MTLSSMDHVMATYERLLAAIGDRADEIGDRPVVTHWPHVGNVYRGTEIVGQALRGWPDDFPASSFRITEGRAHAFAVTRARNADRPDPLDWIETSRVRSSPFWKTSRILAETLDPT